MRKRPFPFTVLPWLVYMSGGWWAWGDIQAGRPAQGWEWDEVEFGYLDEEFPALPPLEYRPVKETENMTAIPDVLQTALATKVKGEVQPVTDAIAKARSALDAYETLFAKEAERRAVGAMLVALGQPVPEPDPKLREATELARTSIEALLKHLGKADPEPVEVAPTPVPPPPPSVPRVADPATIEAAWNLINEIDETDFTGQHALRLLPLLQALVSECRLHIDKLPREHDLQGHLSNAIRYLGRVRGEQNVDGFIKGLAYAHREDWSRLSYEARKRVSKFDEDSNTPLDTPKSNGKKTNGKSSGEKITYQWPEMPSLRSKIGDGKALLLVGGFRREEKLRVVKERFGLEAEWYETDPSCPRMSEDAVNRVKGGKVAAVVLLNGFMMHKDFKRVSDACGSLGVPCTLGERGGVGSLDTAFSEIERQCSST